MRVDTKRLLECSELMTVAEAADLIGVSKQCIYTKIRSDDLEVAQGPVAMVTKESLARYLKVDLDDAAEAYRAHSTSGVTNIILPAQVTQGVYVTLNASGVPQNVWVGEPERGVRYDVVKR